MLNKLQIAALFQVDRATIDAWCRRGCPVARPSCRQGQPTSLNPEAVLKWRLNDLRRIGYEEDRVKEFRRRLRERLKAFQTGRLF